MTHSSPPSSRDPHGVPPLVEDVLRRTGRRYRAPALPATLTDAAAGGPSTALAVTIEHARAALAAGRAPEDAVRTLFLDALARLIHHAMRPLTPQDDDTMPAGGDPAFQAMVLRRRSPSVRLYASLGAHAERDRRAVRAAVNALAHPAKTERREPGPVRDALPALHAAAEAGNWSLLAEIAARLREQPGAQADPALHRGLDRLIDTAALTQLRRFDALSSDALVARYRALWDRQGPVAGSEHAVARGAGDQRRGDAVEALATTALAALVDRLNGPVVPVRYRVATSLRLPPAFPGDAQRAKSEWDVALLRRHDDDAVAAIESEAGLPARWDLCLLIEAKASPDAAVTDLPRLLRGLRLLAQADPGAIYPFTSREGELRLRGASLRELPTEEGDLARAVVYCCDGADDRVPRRLNAASRMQLLSAEASLDFAALVEDGAPVSPVLLDPVWRLLLEAPAFAPVLHQYPTLRAVRELMVHPDDLLAAVHTAPADR